MTNLVMPFKNDIRKMVVSKNLGEAMREMQVVTSMVPMDSFINQKNGERYIDTNIPTFRIYSAHDMQIANIMVQIRPEEELNVVPFASNVVFEVWQNGYNYKIRSKYNNKPIEFKTNPGFRCEQDDKGHFCTPDAFFNYMDQRLILNATSLQNQCDEPAPTYYPGGSNPDYENDKISDWKHANYDF